MSMWRPPQRIRHDPQPGRWPSAAEISCSPLFQPIQVGAIALRQRTWVPAMVPWRATEEGFVTPNVLAWYERFARGRPGAIVVEATGIRDVASGPLLRISEGRFIAGLRSLVDTVKAGERRRDEASHSTDRFSFHPQAPGSAEILRTVLADHRGASARAPHAGGPRR